MPPTSDERLLVQSVLKDISDVVRRIDDAQSVSDQLVTMVAHMLQVGRCSLMVIEPETETLRMVSAHGLRRELIESYRGRIGEGISGWVAKEGKPLLITDVERHPLFKRKSGAKYSTKSLLSVPLLAGDRVIGVLNVNNKSDDTIFTKSDELLLGVVANFMVIAMDKARMREVEHQKQLLDAELQLAREIQEDLLPETMPSDDLFEFAACCRPARQVAGDFYDLLPSEEGKVCLVLGDVCGKGVPAALYMSRVLTYFRFGAELNRSADGIMTFVNSVLAREWTERTFVTACVAVTDRDAGVVHICNGGHNPPYLLHAASGRLDVIESSDGMPPGVLKEAHYCSRPLRMDSGDVLVIYTDGITEARNVRDELFGVERLEAIIRSAPASAAAMIAAIMAAVEQFCGEAPLSDDCTLAVMRRR